MAFFLGFIAVLIAIFIGYLVYKFTGGEDQAPFSLIGGGISLVLAAIIGLTITSGFGTVPAGSVGVVAHWTQPTGDLKTNGLYFVCRICGYSVYPMQASTIRQWPINDAAAATQDLQQVSTNITMNFHLNGDPKSLINVYTNLRDNFDNVIGPITLEAMKAVTAKYTAQNLIDKRAEAKGELDSLLSDRLGKYGIVVDNISLTDFKFSDQFNSAIEAKVTQEQSALQAEAALKQTQWEAKSTMAKADAAAYQLRIQRQVLTPELLEQQAIAKWNGQLPTVISGGGGNIMGLPPELFSSKQ